MSKRVLVAAMEREIKPLIRGWRTRIVTKEGRSLKFFENGDTVAVCGGVGAVAAGSAALIAVDEYRPQVLYSVGYAGALTPQLRAGMVFVPNVVLPGTDDARFEPKENDEILVTIGSVASGPAKQEIAAKYKAHAIDMEAAAVFGVAQQNNLEFVAVKAITDGVDFIMPPLHLFVNQGGEFQTLDFAFFVLFRPSLWKSVIQLHRNSALATRQLCTVLANSCVGGSNKN